MRKTRLSFRFLQIALFALCLIALSQYFSTKYLGDLSNKVDQAIAETETLSISVVATGEGEGK